MIVFDEFLYGESIDKRNYLNENHLVSECTYLARYLLECGEKEEQVKCRLKNILQISGVEDYRSLIDNIIRKSMKNAKLRKCRKFTELIFYKKEIERIKNFKTIDIQKIAFSLLILSKVFGSEITTKKSDIMKLVGANYSGSRYNQIINILINAEFLSLKTTSWNYREIKIKVPKTTRSIISIPNDTEIEFIVRDYRNIIGAFIDHIGNPVFQCSRCGGVFEKTKSTNILCQNCKKQNKLERDRERYKNKQK